MTNIRIRTNIPDVRRAMRRAPDVVMGEIDRGLKRGANEVARTARTLAPKATSGLTQSILARRTGAAQYIVVARAGYAGPVEFGRKPGRQPPVQSIVDWMRTRRIATGAGPRRQRQIAFAIARKIGREGTKAQPFMGPALERNRSRLTQLMNESTRRGVARALA